MVARVLFPGRFQPFHRGHELAVEWLLSKFDEVVLVIGSAQEGFTCKNPLTGGERVEMIGLLAKSKGWWQKIWIVTAPDIRMPPAWAYYVLSLSPRVEAVASGNPEVLLPFKWAGLKTLEVPLFEPQKYSGTAVREAMKGGGAWRALVPGPVADFLDSAEVPDRVRRLCCGEAAGNRR